MNQSKCFAASLPTLRIRATVMHGDGAQGFRQRS
jgi:hypothetical protein